jgi:hypothetical protein
MTFKAFDSHKKILVAASKARELAPDLRQDDHWKIPADENLETATVQRISCLLATNAISRLCLSNKDYWDYEDKQSLARFKVQEEILVAALRKAMGK